jgi:hypothetical protein
VQENSQGAARRQLPKEDSRRKVRLRLNRLCHVNEGPGRIHQHQDQRGHGVTTATASSANRIQVTSTAEASLPAVPLAGPGVAPRVDRRDGWSRGNGSASRRIVTPVWAAAEPSAGTWCEHHGHLSGPCLPARGDWRFQKPGRNLTGGPHGWCRCATRRSCTRTDARRSHAAWWSLKGQASLGGRLHERTSPFMNPPSEQHPPRRLRLTYRVRRYLAVRGAELLVLPCCHASTLASPHWAKGVTSRRSTRIRTLSTRTSSRDPEPLDESSNPLPPGLVRTLGMAGQGSHCHSQVLVVLRR